MSVGKLGAHPRRLVRCACPSSPLDLLSVYVARAVHGSSALLPPENVVRSCDRLEAAPSDGRREVTAMWSVGMMHADEFVVFRHSSVQTTHGEVLRCACACREMRMYGHRYLQRDLISCWLAPIGRWNIWCGVGWALLGNGYGVVLVDAYLAWQAWVRRQQGSLCIVKYGPGREVGRGK